MRLFANIWAAKKIQINCNNQAVVTVLTTGKTRDAFLAACASNIWYVTAIHDMGVQYKHVNGVNNQVIFCRDGTVLQPKLNFCMLRRPTHSG